MIGEWALQESCRVPVLLELPPPICKNVSKDAADKETRDF